MLTLLNESARQFMPAAPRIDLLGQRALARAIESLGGKPPSGQRLRGAALAGDLISNSLYFSLVGAGEAEHRWRRGLLLGLGAGLGTVLLPPLLGLGNRPAGRAHATQAMTVAWYVAGGLTAAGAQRYLGRDS